MNFGATANVANLALYQNGRLDCFERRHSFSRLPDVLFERQGGEVENNRVEPCLCDFLRARAGVRMVRIEKDREVKLIAQTLHQSCDLADSHKGTFTFGCANDHWHMYVPRSSKHCFQQNEVRDVEVPDGFTAYSRLAQDIPQRLHTKTSFAVRVCEPDRDHNPGFHA